MRGGNQEPIFLVGLGDQHGTLAHRVIELGYRPVRAEDTLAASLLIARLDRPVRAAIVPARFEFLDRASELARLASDAGSLQYIATGKEVPPDDVDGLRRDGVRFCLWEPFTESELRFVINRALYDTTRGEVRENTRVPTNLVARVRNGAGEKTAGVYNLSSSGAFLETQRSSVKGGNVRVVLPLAAGDLELPAVVTSTNVPGNLKRGNLPTGMGVEFVDLDGESRAALESLVAQRATSFEL
jgi:hypothetical protein